MRWKDETLKRPYFLDLIFSKEIIYDAFTEGYLKWHLYTMAIQKIESNMNGIKNGYWKFENADRRC